MLHLNLINLSGQFCKYGGYNDGVKKVSCVLLAAGESKRFPGNKLLAPLINDRTNYQTNDRTVIKKTLENVIEADIEELVIVLGHEGEKVEKTIKKYFEKSSRLKDTSLLSYKIVYNQEYKKGLSSIDEKASGVLFCLGDQPLISSSVINEVIKKFKTTSCDVVYPTYKGQRGNPVLFDKSLFNKLKEIDRLYQSQPGQYGHYSRRQDKDRGGRQVIKEAKSPCRVEVFSTYILMEILPPLLLYSARL